MPATSANLGPGFDLFGLALTLYSRFFFQFNPENGRDEISFAGAHAPDLPPPENLIRTGFLLAMKRKGVSDVPVSLNVQIQLDLPLARGFGSSASAFVAGVAAASHFLKNSGGSPLNLQEELSLLNELEGHPDNVFPARLGGWIMGFQNTDGSPGYLKKKLPPNLGLAVIVPRFEVSTRKSRTSLPLSYSLEDIKSNLSGIGLWMEYVHSGNAASLREALLCDRIHEPYRKEKIPGYLQIRDKLLQTGCYGVTISGSGPGILIYFDREKSAAILPEIRQILEQIGREHGQDYPLIECSPDEDGLTLE